MKTYKTICSVLLIAMIAFLFSGCKEMEDREITAPIITTKYSSKSGNYLIMLEGRKAISVHQTRLKITIRPGTMPTIAFFVNAQGNLKRCAGVDYEFIFSDYEQAKEYLHLEPSKGEQIHIETEATADTCFISILTK